MTRRQWASTVAAALVPRQVGAQLAPFNRRWAALQKALDEFIAEHSAPGVTVAISYGDSAPAYPSAGTLAFDSQKAFDENSICRIYSMTKNVTRIAPFSSSNNESSSWTSPSRTFCRSLRT